MKWSHQWFKKMWCMWVLWILLLYAKLFQEYLCTACHCGPVWCGRHPSLLILCCHDECFCAAFIPAFSSHFLDHPLLLSVTGTCYAGAYPSRKVHPPLLRYCIFAAWGIHLAAHLCGPMLLMCFWILVVSLQTVSLTHTSHRPPLLHLVCCLYGAGLGLNLP